MFEIGLNEIVIQPVATANTALAVNSELYNIESNNTVEARSQSVATATGNEHTIVKTANESIIATKISGGELAVLDTSTANASQNPAALAMVTYFVIN